MIVRGHVEDVGFRDYGVHELGDPFLTRVYEEECRFCFWREKGSVLCMGLFRLSDCTRMCLSIFSSLAARRGVVIVVVCSDSCSSNGIGI